MGGRGALKLSNSGFLSESLPQDRMSDGNPGWVQSLACVCYILKLKFSTHASGGELCATAAGVDCGTIRKVPQNPGTSEYWTLNLELWSCTLNFDLWMLQGLNILIPIVDRIKYVQSLKEKAIDIPSQSAITEGNLAHLQVGGKWSNLKFYFCYPDNVTLHLDGVLYYRVINPFKVGGYTVVYWVSTQSVQWNYMSVCCVFCSVFLWCGGCRVCSDTAGPDNHEVWTGYVVYCNIL